MHDPFKIDGPTCISFSGGRTSAYMLWRVLQSNDGKLPKDARVVFANTGKEDRGTLDFVDRCAREWKVSIAWVEYADNSVGFRMVFNREACSETGEPFEALIRKRNYLPNPVTRFCTSDLKIKPITAMLRHAGWGDFDMMVGIRADEPRRLAKMRHLLTPLAAAGITKQAVLEFWRKQPFDLETDAGNCDLCFNKGLPELMSLVRRRPERAVWWAMQEQAIGATFHKDRPSYAQMKDFAERQQEMFTGEGAIACFCGD